jgi:hypothetical protein
MPTFLADARGGARLALVRELPVAARPVSAQSTAPSPSWSDPAWLRDARKVAGTAAGAVPSAAMGGAATSGSRGRVAGAVVLVTLLGMVLLAALAASATLAWAGR